MNIYKVTAAEEKKTIARQVLEALPEWFGIPQAREEYIADSAEQTFFAAEEAGRVIGFICLKETGRDTIEHTVMGGCLSYHRRFCVRSLCSAARDEAAAAGYSFLQVKTVQMGRYKEYDDTNRFYRSLGFKELEVFPTLWDEWNPCQIYVMSIE